MAFRKGCIPWNKGKKGVQVIWNKGLPKEQQPRYQKKHTPETKEKMGKKRSDKWQDPEYREYTLTEMRKRSKEDWYRQRISAGNKKVYSDPERKRVQGIKMKIRRQDPEFIRRLLKAQGTKPNKAELRLNGILQEHFSGEFALNVRAEIMVLDRKIPDFVNVNSKKKLIELFGDYWHSQAFTGREKEDEEYGRTECFRRLG